MQYDKPLLSDSGGFQVFSLIHKNKAMGKILDDRVEFKSPVDGSWHILTPEKSIQIQFDLGVDMMVCLDDCPPNDFDRNSIDGAVNRTIAWAKRCRVEFDKQIKKRKIKPADRPLLFGVIQGGIFNDVRERCAAELAKIGFDGFGFGARPVDVDGNFLGEILQVTADASPVESLRFGLGIGLPEDIVRCVAMGWDMFDCVIPTREGRHGRLFYQTKKISLDKPTKFYETINISNSKFSKDFSPINKKSKLPELRNNSKAYLYHLFKIKEPLGQRLASLNNLEFYTRMMDEIRENI
jgi:queuine tRNA-ribosyltransferase